MMADSAKTARLAQALIAAPFLVLGAWCLVAPGMVERLSLTPEHRIDSLASRILLGCFGAQAMLSGLFAAFSRFTRLTFLAYGLALLPFFGFNIYFTLIVPVFTPLMWLDAIANVFMLSLCVIGWRALAPTGARVTQMEGFTTDYGRRSGVPHNGGRR